MSEQKRWPTFGINKEVRGLSPETTFKYGIPYAWGALHVTSQAEEAYGFVPLTANAINGDGIDITKQPETGIRTDIYLMGLQEFTEHNNFAFALSNFEMNDIGVSAASIGTDKIELRLALSRHADDLRESILDDISRIAHDLGSDIDDVMDHNNMPISESIGQSSSQILMHGLCAFTARKVHESAVELANAQLDKKALRRMTALGGAGLAGAGTLLTMNGLINHGNIDVLSASLAMSYVGAYAYNARRTIKQHLASASVRQPIIEDNAERYAIMVADDVHATFCSSHFDNNAEQMLKDN